MKPPGSVNDVVPVTLPVSAAGLPGVAAPATGVPENFPGAPAGFSARQLPDANVQSEFLKLFGKPQRIGLSEQVRSGMNNQVGMNRCFVAAVAHNSHEIPQMNECSYIHEYNIVILCCQPIAIGNCRGKAF